MARVRQKGGRIDGETGGEFADHEGQVDGQGDGVAPISRIDGSMVVACMTMTSVVVVMVGGVIVIRVAVSVGAHGPAYTPFREKAKSL